MGGISPNQTFLERSKYVRQGRFSSEEGISPMRLQSERVRLLFDFNELLRGMLSRTRDITSPDLASHVTPCQEQQSLLVFHELRALMGNSFLNSKSASLWRVGEARVYSIRQAKKKRKYWLGIIIYSLNLSSSYGDIGGGCWVIVSFFSGAPFLRKC
ncbi:unnamed protein product [Thlaspi arvense]|uniref:Uncharacterized protein n=1 Tax=Thlaspi arvense TaxID=13288 RepID=A0AAU9SLY4_THLAR|nr:unnamed protein product [Thlaspi arvense]